MLKLDIEQSEIIYAPDVTPRVIEPPTLAQLREFLEFWEGRVSDDSAECAELEAQLEAHIAELKSCHAGAGDADEARLAMEIERLRALHYRRYYYTYARREQSVRFAAEVAEQLKQRR